MHFLILTISVIPAFTETQDGRQPHDGGAISTSAAEATHLTGAEISRKKWCANRKFSCVNIVENMVL